MMLEKERDEIFDGNIHQWMNVFNWALGAVCVSSFMSLLMKEGRMYSEDVLYGLNPYEIGLMV